MATVTAAIALLAVMNLTLMRAAQSAAIRIGETTPFDRVWAEQARVFHDWFGNPFTYPASLLFAFHNGVSPGDYDLLSTNRFLADPLQPYGRVDVGADDEWSIVDGWHAPERDGTTTFRWASSPATLRLPLDHAERLRVQVRLHAFGFPGAPPQTLTIATPSQACGPMAVGESWQTVECVLDRGAWRTGVNVLTLQFAWSHKPADVGAGGDQRNLAAAIDYVRVALSAP
jgi:hypothetical protein